MSGQLAGKVAIITGASSGIGRATAKVFAAEGASVTVTGRRGDRLSDLVNEIGPVQALSVPADITDRAGVDIVVAQTMTTFGHVDILVNNAGVMLLSAVEEVLVDEWDRMIDVNIKGLLYGVAAVLPHMRAQSSGHIINVDSVAGRRPFPTGTIYSATKFAVRCISAGLREELSPTYGIRVTDIQPGIVDTELLDHVSDPGAVDAFYARWGDKMMLSADDVANAILYAASQPPHVNVNELLVRPTDQEG